MSRAAIKSGRQTGQAIARQNIESRGEGVGRWWLGASVRSHPQLASPSTHLNQDRCKHAMLEGVLACERSFHRWLPSG